MADGERTTDPLEDTSSWPPVQPPPVPEAPAAGPAPAPTPAPPPAGGSSWTPPPPASGSLWTPARPDRKRRGDDNGGRVLGVILIVVGAWLLVRRYVDLDTELVLPIVAIAIGGVLLASGMLTRGRNG
jgi:hypothetical protein